MATSVKYLDHPPAGWFVLDVLKINSRRWNWAALMIDVPVDQLAHCQCSGVAMLYVHPDEYRPGKRLAREAWVRIPGKHRSYDAACEPSLCRKIIDHHNQRRSLNNGIVFSNDYAAAADEKNGDWTR
jgi:hypothetical protein